ncbi:expressed unknown protein [Seminavis robusta]|uniref:Exostosin GT47 domain-containing protein n=1 Tax=Seminavis robusta TaxID=568900 RepID=A0A9N8EBW4_9STRA|nr:expressed unknown protein [Seminavis robusta]|eukprot:Sro778_g201190.1 n/a (608) ;mRNA; f:33479-35302
MTASSPFSTGMSGSGSSSLTRREKLLLLLIPTLFVLGSNLKSFISVNQSNTNIIVEHVDVYTDTATTIDRDEPNPTLYPPPSKEYEEQDIVVAMDSGVIAKEEHNLHKEETQEERREVQLALKAQEQQDEKDNQDQEEDKDTEQDNAQEDNEENATPDNVNANTKTNNQNDDDHVTPDETIQIQTKEYQPDSDSKTLHVEQPAEKAEGEGQDTQLESSKTDTTTIIPIHNKNTTDAEIAFYQNYVSVIGRQDFSNMMVWNTRDRTHPLGRFWGFWERLSYFKFPKEKDPDIPARRTMRHAIVRVDTGICRAARYFASYRSKRAPGDTWPHVLLVAMHEDYGAFSSAIPGRTGDTKNLHEEWKKQKCNERMILEYINHPETLAIFTCQYQIWNHAKIHSVPLGMRYGTQARQILNRVREKRQKLQKNKYKGRTQLLMMNSKKRKMRAAVMDAVLEKFNASGIPLKNTYTTRGGLTGYLDEMQAAKFIMSPSGTGIDCYRHWEALLSGCIPVIETWNRTHTDGYFKSFDHLPVALIDSYHDLTPEWLDVQYTKLIQRTDYDWTKLTASWWIELIQSYLPAEYKQQPPKQQQLPSSSAINKKERKRQRRA